MGTAQNLQEQADKVAESGGKGHLFPYFRGQGRAQPSEYKPIAGEKGTAHGSGPGTALGPPSLVVVTG